MTCEAISYCDLLATLISDGELQQSAELFSNHYGKWAGTERRVKMSAAKLREQILFDTSTCSIMQAWHEPDSGVRNLVGHAFVCRFQIPDKVIALYFVVVRAPLYSLTNVVCVLLRHAFARMTVLFAFVCNSQQGEVSWITQLVVHLDWRKRGIAKQLCRLACGTRNHYFVCGLVSSHPYAARALEGATMRRCDRNLALQHAQELINYSGIPYIKGKDLCFDDGRCLIDTQFPVDHSGVDHILLTIDNWQLGPLDDNKEFFAFTFATTPTSC
jgi:hypothetical protein